MITNKLGRPLLAAMFISGGIDQLRNPKAKVPMAEGVAQEIAEPLGLPDDTETLVKINGAVSPAARATASMRPAATPLNPVLRTTDRAVRHIGTPSAREASRRLPGTSRRLSSVVRMTTGTMMIASARLPANALNWWNGSTNRAKAKMPIRIDGMPTMTSAAKRIRVAVRRPLNSTV